MAVTFHPGSVEHSLDAKHPRTGLVVTSELTTSDDPSCCMRSKLDPAVAPFLRRPTDANVGPYVTAGPSEYWRRGDRGRRRLVCGPSSEIGGVGQSSRSECK